MADGRQPPRRGVRVEARAVRRRGEGRESCGGEEGVKGGKEEGGEGRDGETKREGSGNGGLKERERERERENFHERGRERERIEGERENGARERETKNLIFVSFLLLKKRTKKLTNKK